MATPHLRALHILFICFGFTSRIEQLISIYMLYIDAHVYVQWIQITRNWVSFLFEKPRKLFEIYYYLFILFRLNKGISLLCDKQEFYNVKCNIVYNAEKMQFAVENKWKTFANTIGKKLHEARLTDWSPNYWFCTKSWKKIAHKRKWKKRASEAKDKRRNFIICQDILGNKADSIYW